MSIVSTIPYEERIKWFHEARFGMFIHYGLYTLLGRGEWVQWQERIPQIEYQKLAKDFQPQANCIDQWLDLAVEAGMRYAVLTTKHHDGFCLFDTKTTEFKTTATAGGRDLVAEFVEGCRKRDLKVGVYLSDIDWNYAGYFDPESHPDSKEALVESLHEQTRELLGNYGQIDLLWYDGSWVAHGAVKVESEAEFWRAESLLEEIYKLQPHILVNNRLGLDADLDTPEQHVTASAGGRGWESCMTIGDAEAWGWCRYLPNRKTVATLLHNLATAASGEGNYLLNIGPKPDGSVDEGDASRLREVGAWMKVHGDCIRNSQRFSPDKTRHWQGALIRKGTTVYLMLFRYSTEVPFPVTTPNPVRARLFTTGEELQLRKSWNGGVTITGLPEVPPHPEMTVIELEFEAAPQVVKETDRAAWIAGELH